LVGRQETAVAELVKNAYDADATEVILTFKDTDFAGGTLIIEDNGHGMSRDDIKNGFMRLSSTSKIHNPVSPKFNRKRAGRKGIGRFSTQRLGEQLVITTQTLESKTALRVVINWNAYEIDTDINLIANDISEMPKEKPYGTTLTIAPMREKWTLAEIQRVFRYVSDLLQPAYLSDRLKKSDIVFGVQGDESFTVTCRKQVDNYIDIISDVDRSFFDKSLATFEGFINEEGKGFCYVSSKSLDLSQSLNEISIEPSKERYPTTKWPNGEKPKKFLHLENTQIQFKAYYFIYNRVDYYEGNGIGVTSSNLKQISSFGKTNGGIKLYRNGFRVAPYGDAGDDWLNLDYRYTSEGGDSNRKNIIPLANKNVFGFVEIIDENGSLFEETSSREGLLNNESFRDLSDFLQSSFEFCRNRLESTAEFKEKRLKWQKRLKEQKTQKERLEELKIFVEEKAGADEEDDKKFNKEELKLTIDDVSRTIEEQLDEISMLRILAGIGLSIGEFVHEMRQFSPVFQSEIEVLSNHLNTGSIGESVKRLSQNFEQFRTYAAYFDDTIRQNVNRELKPIDIRDVVRDFLKIIERSALKNNISIEPSFDGYDLYTCPMHSSEWSSILFNLYSNANKAIIKARTNGKILIQAKEESGKIIFEFCDNGIGIDDAYKDRIFTAFFTTSTPSVRGSSQNDEMIGSGLGLKIVSDIIESYDGEIFVSNPPDGYKTCMRIEIPKATEQQINEQINNELFSAG
jgi:signal transduction histidine kinase